MATPKSNSIRDDKDERQNSSSAGSDLASSVGAPRTQNNPAVRYAVEIPDDFGVGPASRHQRNSMSRWETKRSVIIDLPKLRQHKGSDTEDPLVDPAIVWNVKTYQSTEKSLGEDHRLHRPDLTYVDDRPIELPVGRSRELSAEPDDDMPDPAAWAVGSHCLDLWAPKRVSSRQLTVKSPFLAEGLRSIVQYYPSFHQMLFGETIEAELRIEDPFTVLFHHFDAIAAMAGEITGAICNAGDDSKNTGADLKTMHAQFLMAFLRPIYKESILACQEHLSNSVPQVAFDMIWYPLRPGTDVYVQLDGSTHAAVVMGVRHTHVSWSKVWGTEGDGSWLVDLWWLKTDGSRLYRDFISTRITPYSGFRDVTSLQVCPVSIWDAHDGGKRRGKILCRSATLFKALQRGNLLVDYQGPIKETSQYYTGKVVIDHRRGRAESDFNQGLAQQVRDYSDLFQEYDGILINDDRSFYTTQSTQSRCQNLQFKPTTSNDAVTHGKESQEWLNDVHDHNATVMIPTEAAGCVVQRLTEHQLLLLCPDILAYGLRHKRWMLISLDYVQESVPSEESISNLIIAQDELKTIQALSNRQTHETKHWSADFIEGKGSGQIILLHDNLFLGPPGVGKTYTVEAISDWLHRPLLALTVADIGTVETLVEDGLIKWFDLAEAWNAVLLVDEADIFLERRQNRDLARNGLVSAFLRRTEYFKGLLFLTTNRVGQIDDAFISRVHVAIGYQALDEETRRKIWSGFFRKLVRERAGKVQIAPDAKKWVLDTAGETSLNGRDIRNALQTAITLAEFESEEDPDYDASLVTVVTKAHFQKVLEMCNRFRSYVTSIRREDEMKRAQGRGDRNDYGSGFDSRMC
ncbi:TOB3 (member of AAA-ATPase family) [Fusarium circinatum]|uniref:TOB3 (Member of AAA-ATPase family) n=1 Tax=Fusarium circinatum TaxID=48490 RepID=A0A8H5TWK8_FUSCI|nr:TOB3 (member of AAA-ATPase family) [Fusarium circinatum]